MQPTRCEGEAGAASYGGRGPPSVLTGAPTRPSRLRLGLGLEECLSREFYPSFQTQLLPRCVGFTA